MAERTADTVEGALQFAGLPDADVRRRSQTWAEMLVRFLTSPVVSSLLMTVGASTNPVRSPRCGLVTRQLRRLRHSINKIIRTENEFASVPIGKRLSRLAHAVLSHRHALTRGDLPVVVMQPIDQMSFDAFARLLARPDPPDLPRRGNIRRCEGDPNRRTTRLPGILMASLQRRCLEEKVEEPLASATRPRNIRGRDVDSGLCVLTGRVTC